MHHGLHEKQISNVFRWLLEEDGTHGFGSGFTEIFIEQINAARAGSEPLPASGYVVRQEVNTATSAMGADIADLVLDGADSRIVVENYFTSDGHGHVFHGYRSYSERLGKRGEVVLLCRDRDASLQTDG